MLTVKSLREFAFDSVQAFLFRENFTHSNDLIKGIAYLASNICQYQEESMRLNPELLITTDVLSIAKILPTHVMIPIAVGPVSIDTFKKALKACAPLAKESWIIYINIEPNLISYGLLASGVASPNPSPYSHLKDIFPELTPSAIYFKALSPKLLMVKGKREEIVISFSLEEHEYEDNNHVNKLAEHISRFVVEEWRIVTQDLFVGLLEQAFAESHGCLVAVLNNDPTAMTELRQQITNGIFIPEPINIAERIIQAQETHSSNDQMLLYSICGVVRRMISHDGIALFSSDGRLLGYNLFIPSNDNETKGVIGGARSRAFQKLCSLQMLSCVFFRSQDGAVLIKEI
jgi:hypothetical protein